MTTLADISAELDAIRAQSLWKTERPILGHQSSHIAVTGGREGQGEGQQEGAWSHSSSGWGGVSEPRPSWGLSRPALPYKMRRGRGSPQRHRG